VSGKRKDSRGETTRLTLIEAAEELFSRHGVQNVSLRQIGDAIGSDNNGIVTYYFGSKEGLVRAVYEHRIMELEERRKKILRQADEAGRGEDILTLIYALFSPIFEQRNKKGKPSYAGFLASVLHFGSALPTILYPTPQEIAKRLRRISGLSEELFAERLHLTTTILIDATHTAAKLKKKKGRPGRIDVILADALQMAASALSAPVGTSQTLRRLEGSLSAGRSTRRSNRKTLA
jgi:AcrR family transcriptional regulator